jgi:hypothetical protein
MSEKPDQIQASVAAALSRLRGDVGPSGAAAPNIEEQHGNERARPANDVQSDPFFRSVQSPPLGAGMVGSGRAPIPMTPFPTMQAPQYPGAMEPETPDEVAPDSASSIEIPDMPERAAGPDLVAMPEHDAARTEALRSAPEAVAAAPGGGNNPLSRMMRGSGAPGSGGPAQRDLLADLPPPPISEPIAGDTESAAANRRRRNRRLVALAAIIIVAAVGAWLWTSSEPGTEVPVITADATPEKVKPADEGGLQVQNQDVQVLDPSAQTQTETVMPEPEQPITPPAQTAPGENAGSEQAPIVVDGADGNSATTAQVPTGDAPPAPGVPLTETPLPAMEESGTATTADTANTTTGAAEPTTGEAAPSAPATSVPESVQAAPTQAAEAPAVSEQAPAQNAAEATSAPTQAPTPAPTSEPAQAAQPEAPAAQAAPTQEAAVTPSAPKQAAPTGTRVQLAAGKSEAAVQKEWVALQKAHPQLLGSLSLMIERVDKGEAGVFYRLQAGPLADKKAAGQLCSGLKQQGQDCIVVAK